MQELCYQNTDLRFEDADLAALAEAFGTPLYVYSAAAVHRNFARIDGAFAAHPHLICYALKANSNPALLRELAALGAGADVVSQGELHLALQAGMPPEKIVFAGIGKRDEEIVAGLQAGIRGFNVESVAELEVIASLAQDTGLPARVALRINPDIDIQGHPYISTGRRFDKFGIPIDTVRRLIREFAFGPHCRLAGLHVHLGSQIDRSEPFRRLGEVLHELAVEVQQAGYALDYLDAGGGIGVDYRTPIALEPNARGGDDLLLDPQHVAGILLASLRPVNAQVIFEPGRALVANAGLLLTRVLYIKPAGDRLFVIVDAGMNDLLRPSLYDAFHAVVPVRLNARPVRQVDIVGPICESGDFLARNRRLPLPERGDLLAVLTAGAYGYTLASNYNARPRPAEVLVAAGQAQLVRAREEVTRMWREAEFDV